MSAAPKAKSPLMPYAVLALLCAALGIVGLMLKGKADASFTNLAASKDEYRGMVKLREAALVERAAGDPDVEERTEPWEDFLGYLSSVQTKYGIAPKNMPKGFMPTPSSPLPGGGWTTYGISIDLFGNKEEPLQMRDVTLFLDEVERSKLFLKSATINLRLSEGNTVLSGGVSLQYWIRTP
jgi:hypothetical protein